MTIHPHSDLVKRLSGGCLIPVLTFFSDSATTPPPFLTITSSASSKTYVGIKDEDVVVNEQPIDLNTFTRHVQWLAKSGVKGIIVCGSTGEAVTLSQTERNEIVRAARQALDGSGYQTLPVVSGVTAQSTQDVISQAKYAALYGAEAVLALPPSYYAPSMTQEALREFYIELAEKSPIPIIIYSWPNQSGGLELSSDDVIDLAKSRPNIIGIKHTDHNVGKMSRIATSLSKEHFVTMGGSSDYLIASLIVGCLSNVPGTGNICPASCQKLFQLYQDGKGVSEEAKILQGQISTAGSAFGSGGIALLKAATQHYFGYGGKPRRPVPPISEQELKSVVEKVGPIMQVEKSLGFL